jgi:leucyl aminopeptidase
MKLILTTKAKADIEIILIKNKKIELNKNILRQLKFKGKDEESILLPEAKKLYVGCEDNHHNTIRIALATAIKKLNTTNFKSAKIICEDNLKAVVDGLKLGNYKFDKYKTKKKKKKEKEIYIQVDKITKTLQQNFEESIVVCEAINIVRDMVNTPPEDFYPEIMELKALEIAKKNNLKCQIFDDKYFEANGMNAISAVGRASRHDSKLIHLSYKPKNSKKKIVLVGKGLTYDSGGLSLKPADFMATMKSDKSGGCVVLGIMSIVSKLNLPFEIHGIVGAVENMIGGDAYKPDDILKAKDGTTIEIRNTDAEGRLVLADCLCYAQDEIKNIDYLIDFATLTGACMVGVGEYTSGIMGNNIKLNHQIVQSAINSGEYATTLPFNRFLKKTIKSEIADICNIANTRYGGAITAGLFLEHFIKDENKQKWVHCDIAGPSYVEKSWGYNPYGASGIGVRMIIEFLKGIDVSRQ